MTTPQSRQSTSGRPFVDFYRENRISPVHQDISDLTQHFDRRGALYRHLGVPPKLLSGRSVIEFGPGSGYNALYTTSLQPRRYVLVDGNATGINEAKALLHSYFPAADFHEFAESLIENFDTSEQFDLVLCEGVIPFQIDPTAFTRNVGRFVSPGGIFFTTCIDAISYLGEMTRRLMRDVMMPMKTEVSVQLEKLRPIFSSHLDTLPGRSRPIDDWLLDNIVQPILGEPYSVAEAVHALQDEFDVYGSSPRFFVDWRWYKNIHGRDKRYNEEALASYYSHVANMIDYRVVMPAQPQAFGEQVASLCRSLFTLMKKIENDGRDDLMSEAIGTIRALATALDPVSRQTATSLDEVAAFLQHGGGPGSGNLEGFRSLFGRGQVYLSFIRREL